MALRTRQRSLLEVSSKSRANT